MAGFLGTLTFATITQGSYHFLICVYSLVDTVCCVEKENRKLLQGLFGERRREDYLAYPPR